MLAPWKESYDKPRQCIKKQRHNFADKRLSSQSYGFSSSHVWMWDLDHKEGWGWKNWCLWTVVLERLLRVPWTARRSNQLILKEINFEYSLEGLLLNFQHFGYLTQRAIHWTKGPNDGKDWRQKEKRATEEEIVRYHHWFNGHKLEQTLGDTGGQRILGVLQSLGSIRVRHNLAVEQKQSVWLRSYLCQTGITGKGLARITLDSFQSSLLPPQAAFSYIEQSLSVLLLACCYNKNTTVWVT